MTLITLFLEDFLQTRAMNRNIEDYVGENDLIVQLAKQGKELGMRTGPGTSHSIITKLKRVTKLKKVLSLSAK